MKTFHLDIELDEDGLLTVKACPNCGNGFFQPKIIKKLGHPITEDHPVYACTKCGCYCSMLTPLAWYLPENEE